MNTYEANNINDLTPSEGLEFQINDDGSGYIVVGSGSCRDKDIVIPSTYSGLPVTEIGEGAFRPIGMSGITSIYIPDSVKVIGKHAFENCESLVEINIPSGITVINDYTFLRCDRLSKITLPDTVTEIGACAFDDCDSLTEITLNSGLKTINWGAFECCKNLRKIDIPEGVEIIDYYLFDLCTRLKEISIPKSVKDINPLAFNDCLSLERITVHEDNEHYKSIDGNLYTKDGSTLVHYASGKNDESFYVPSDVTTIDEFAFEYSKKLKTISIPDSVKEIKRGAFYHCEALESIHIPDGVTKIAHDTFSHCNALECITIPKSVTRIEAYSMQASMIIFEDPTNWQTAKGGLFSGISKSLLSDPAKASKAFSTGKYSKVAIKKKT